MASKPSAPKSAPQEPSPQEPSPQEPSPTKAPGVRARVRAELTAEIKRAARDQLVADGASGLSLRAIARELDMASSAIYRYFPSRDELLTALIIDAYDALGQIVEAASASCAEDDYVARFVAIGRALRTWAAGNPHEYALIYGSPVPGYVAPTDTIDPASRIPIALLTVLVEAEVAQPAKSDTKKSNTASDRALESSLAELMTYTGNLCPAPTLARGVEAWAELFGLISLELFGHFKNSVTDPEAFYDHAIASLARRTLAV